MSKDLSKQLQVIALRRRGAILLPETKAKDNDEVSFAAFLKEINNYGFYLDILDESVVNAFKNKEITAETLGSTLEAMNYAFDLHEGARILYPNFPKEVEETPDLKLFVDALIYAISGFSEHPKKNPEYDRLIEDYTSKKELKSLTFIHDDEMTDIFWNIAESKTALSKADKEDLDCLLNRYSDSIVETAKDHEIPFKETMAKLVVEFCELGLDARYLMKTPTDLLRVLQYLAEEETDLKGRFKLPIFNEDVKNLIINTLKAMPFNVEDIMRYKEEWKHIFRFVKGIDVIQEYKEYLYRHKKFQNFYSKEDELFQKIKQQNDTNIFTYVNGELVNKEDDLEKYLEFMSQRPSELIRRIDKLVRLGLKESELERVCHYLENAVAVAERRISYQLLNHLVRRSDSRGVFYGGQFHKLENHEELDCDTSLLLTKAIQEGLKRNFKNTVKEPVIVNRSEYYKDIPVTTSNRLAGENFQSMIPGMKLDLDPKHDYLRIFTSWGENMGDVDLSAVAFTNNDHIDCAYYNLRVTGMTHSGDVRRGPGEEFIDVDLNLLKHTGAKYIFVQNFNYSGRTMDSVKTGVAVLDRKNRSKGKVFKADEVLLSGFATATTPCVAAFVIDIEKMQLVWIDAPVYGDLASNFVNTGESIYNLYEYLTADTLKVQEVFDIMYEVGALKYSDELEDNDEALEEAINLVNLKEDGTLAVKQDLLNKILN